MTLREFMEAGQFEGVGVGAPEAAVRATFGAPTLSGTPDRKGRVRVIRYGELEIGLADGRVTYLSLALYACKPGASVALPTTSATYGGLRAGMTLDELQACIELPPVTVCADAAAWWTAVAYVQDGVVEKVIAAGPRQPFPLQRWGAPSLNVDGIRRVRFEREGVGFLMITQEEGGTFDVWLETLDDVLAEIATLGVSWMEP